MSAPANDNNGASWDSRRIAFDVLGAPAPQGSKRAFVVAGRPVLAEASARVKPWRELVGAIAQQHAPSTPLEGPVAVTLAFRMPVPKSAPKRRRLEAVKRPDLDKLVRAVLDALTHVMWRDDSQVVVLHASKSLAYDAPPGVSIAILGGA